MLINYEKELNPEQLEVVLHGDGPCLVLAGAGSGKTRTLVYRVAYLVERGVNPANILLVTFTNKASREMLDRVSVLLKKNPGGLWGGTFHHIGHRILRMYHAAAGLAPNFTIIDKEDAKTLLKSCVGELDINTKDKKFPKVDVVAAAFSYAANAEKDIEEVLQSRFKRLPEYMRTDLAQLHERYLAKKRTTHVLDFDDLLTRVLELLEKQPHLRQKLAHQFHYILVDEYQDTNRIQTRIIEHLSSEHHNVLVVGDDAQSIYSFRAADVNNILQFPKTYQAVKIFKLERNYRSTPHILALANHSISFNEHRFDKKLTAMKETGHRPEVVACSDAYAQAEFIADTVLENGQEGDDLRSMSVLFRSAYHIIELELELNKRAIPYQVRGGLRFFEQAHIKDILGYLRIAYNLHDELAWKRVLHQLSGVGPTTAERIWTMVRQFANIDELESITATLPPRTHEPWTRLLKLMKKLTSASTVSSLITTILASGYELYVKNSYEDADARLEDIMQMAAFSKSYESLEKFLADAALSEGFKGVRTIAGEETDDRDYLVLSTIHQAKGLEWHTVFIIGLVDGQFPHHKVFEKPQELEEERRLFYVAATRAKENLYLTYPIMSHSVYAKSPFNHPSTFIQELPAHLYEIRELTPVGAEFTSAHNGQTRGLPLQGNSILDNFLSAKKSSRNIRDDEIEYIEE